eukprot:4963641-Ditylum_brightwellii.AAC.1
MVKLLINLNYWVYHFCADDSLGDAIQQGLLFSAKEGLEFIIAFNCCGVTGWEVCSSPSCVVFGAGAGGA